MWKALSVSWALFLGVGLMMLGTGLQSSLLGVRGQLEGFSSSTIGFVMSMYYVGYLFGSTLGPRFVRKVGHVRTFGALASLASVAVLVHAVFVDPVSWSVFRFLTGLSMSGLYLVVESWVNDMATNKIRAQLFSIYTLVNLGGMCLGQFILGLANPHSFVLFIISSSLVSLSLIPILLSVGRPPRTEQNETISVLELYRISPLGVVGAFCAVMLSSIFYTMGPVYAIRELGTQHVPAFMAIGILGGFLFQWPMGKLSDVFDRRIILILSMVLIILVTTLIYLGFFNKQWIYIIPFLFGGTILPLYSLAVAHTNDHLPQKKMVAASGGLILVGGLGATTGPFLASLVMEKMGDNGLFVYVGFVTSCLFLFSLTRLFMRGSLPQSEQGEFVNLPSRPGGVLLNPDMGLSRFSHRVRQWHKSIKKGTHKKERPKGKIQDKHSGHGHTKETLSHNENEGTTGAQKTLGEKKTSLKENNKKEEE